MYGGGGFLIRNKEIKIESSSVHAVYMFVIFTWTRQHNAARIQSLEKDCTLQTLTTALSAIRLLLVAHTSTWPAFMNKTLLVPWWKNIYPFCWMQYSERAEWLYADSAFLRQVHWLLGTGGDKPDHSHCLVFHFCELCIWPRLRLTVCLLFYWILLHTVLQFRFVCI